MKKAKVNRESIVERFDILWSEKLIENESNEWVDVEEMSRSDYDSLVEAFCGNEYKPIKFFTKLVDCWGYPEVNYSLTLSDSVDDDSLYILMDFCKDYFYDSIYLCSHKGFKPSEVFNIIESINSQSEFYDLLIAFESEDKESCSTTVYHGESWDTYKDWIDDLMNKFRNGELDKYHSVLITSCFDDLGIDDKEILENGLYVKFELEEQ